MLTLTVEIGTTLAEAERRLILATLEEHPRKPAAADVLGISLKTLYNKLHGYMATGRAVLERQE